MAVGVEVPDELVQLVSPRLIADLVETAGVGLRFAEESGSPVTAFIMVWDETGTGTGVRTASDGDGEASLADIADQVQDIVITTRSWCGRRPVAWPECPVHQSHPLKVSTSSDAAVWVCPVDEQFSVPIGELRLRGAT
ncbi:MAG TPA: hypothetical protein VJM33_15455 [Microthrixaceae bacterium]|nr:hypothetical protein [Microthrixaceae bacterium]